MPFTLNEIAEALEGTIDGDRSLLIERLATIESADEGSITFLSNKRYEKYLASTNASAIIVSRNQRSERKDIAFIRVDDPYHGFLKTLKLFHGEASPPKPGVHQTAFIDDSADVHPEASIGPHVSIGAHSKIGAGTSIGAGAVIEENCVIGDRCVIYPNVSILARTSIGLDSIIHAGTTIGSDGFGFVPTDGMYEKIPQIGGVIIEDNVEIGANCTIDRGTIGNTIIRSGVKLDNLIQIAHNVEIGENTVVAAQSGISGSASLGKNVVIAGQVGLVGEEELAPGQG